MIPICAQSSVAYNCLKINFWLYFSYTMFRGAMQCLSIFSTTQVWAGVAHARMVCLNVRIKTWLPLVRRLLPPAIGSQLISDYISATRCSLVPRNAFPIFSATQVWGSPCEKGLSQCTDKNMIPTCAQSSAACDWLTTNFWLYFSYTMFCGAMQCLPIFFRHSSIG